MPKAIIMPKFEMAQERATIVRWLKREGDPVVKGEPILEVETDKVVMEVEAPESGTLSGIRFGEGEVVPVTTVIAYVLAEGETPAADAPTPARAATPVARRMAAAEGIDWAGVPGSGPGGKVTRRDIEQRRRAAPAADNQAARADKVRATPAARRVARERGLDLAGVAGSGPRGRVQAADAQAAAQVAAPAPPGEPTIIPLEGMRRAIAERLQASYQQAPHVAFTLDVDMAETVALRAYANQRLPEGQPAISLTAALVQACAWALRRHPVVNSHFRDGQIIVFPDIHIGVAVALDEGLIVPVIHHADRKGLTQLGAEVADLSARAREGRLRPEDVAGGTFTLSNLGMFGIDHFTAILNPPQVAILAVGHIARRVVPDANDQPVVRPMMTVTLSVDHRAIDGAVAARFLATLRDALEHPQAMLL